MMIPMWLIKLLIPIVLTVVTFWIAGEKANKGAQGEGMFGGLYYYWYGAMAIILTLVYWLVYAFAGWF